MRYLRLVYESFRFASQALRSNLTRTTLSLLGVSIGIFAIVAVFTIVDSLENKIRTDMSFIGQDVMYVQRFEWGFGKRNYPWWRYLSRPYNTVDEFKFLEENTQSAKGVALVVGRRSGSTAKYRSNSYDEANLAGVSYGYSIITDLEIIQGRYFTRREAEDNQNVAIIGSTVAEELFPDGNALGKTFKVRGRPLTVIGVMKREGINIFGFSARDNQVILPYKSFGRIYQIGVGRRGVEPVIALKGYEDDLDLKNLEAETEGLMRARRRLKPREENNFALNRTQSFADAITSLFATISIGGWVIGSFSILVGGFGIANIMFVSVKERTNIIGIQKSLGAKNFFILFQFLFEAIFLSMIGGALGLLFVYLITLIPLGFLTIELTLENVILGLGVAITVGVASGIIPAFVASRMDPVVAMRSA